MTSRTDPAWTASSRARVDGLVEDQAAAAATRLAVAAGEVDALLARVHRLPPPSWRGPTADAFAAQLARCRHELQDADDALGRAQGAARRLAGS